MIRWRHPRFKTWTIVWWFLFAGLAALGCSVNYSTGEDLSGNAAHTYATVTTVNHSRYRTWNLSFTNQGDQLQEVHNTQYLKGNPKVGDHVEIYYSTTDPNNSDKITDVRFGRPGSYQFSIARRLGLFALIPLAIGVYGLAIRTRN